MSRLVTSRIAYHDAWWLMKPTTSKKSDVAEGIRRGIVKNAQDHFDNAGFAEGRLPFKEFSLF